jgi:hypothetical protein
MALESARQEEIRNPKEGRNPKAEGRTPEAERRTPNEIQTPKFENSSTAGRCRIVPT